ncbi:ATP-dependent Lon protease [Thermoactinomyces sp. DSM 45891]|uniref:endopeptidase La n=1 Tax=Thermoactinomyces sp. DSM 45891 TaxID=1761907 RepID=UPI00091F65DD|nr:endopeptidase La [Thermoactinomyces sp. DSM 45891]SFX11487.1 ATP-dependent Lon protease [Thermoactinomyces sp. DSM 45891]
MAGKEEERNLPLLPLRGLLVYPSMVIHLDVGREKSIQALEQAMVEDSQILLITQKDAQLEDPTREDLYDIGTVAKVRQMLKLPNGTIRVLVEGLERARLMSFEDGDEYLEASVITVKDEVEESVDLQALMRSVLDYFEQYLRLTKKISAETHSVVSDIEEPGRLADLVASHLPIRMADKQEILQEANVKARLEKLLGFLHNEKEVLELEKKISSRVKRQMEKTQKEYYLREQMKAIQKELGEKEGRAGEIEGLRDQMEEVDLPPDVLEKVEKELDRLEKVPTSSAEGGVIRTYIEWLLDVPWNSFTEDDLDLLKAEKVLDEDHYGLEKVKERVLEYLAVQKMVNEMKGPILCLVGPPGVGKTSLARSVARALDRKFVRISLGGVRDEAEIRGHRRTYVGAMPGRIIQGMKTAGSSNPVFLLDEIDKMAMDFRGDPGAALLEVLDPNQNSTFSDHYLEVPYDLSKVMFITTANSISTIPRPLLDRMELLTISGYTEVEKEQIAKKYLYPKQLKEHGLSREKMQLHGDTILKLIRNYTREAGVRSLERTVGTLCRKAAKQLVAGEKKKVIVTPKNLEQYLGTEKFRFGRAEDTNQVGVVTGLAWTEVGGDTLAVEVSLFPGKGRLTLTGQLGDVMKESAQAAFSYIRSRSSELGVEADFHEKNDIHIHVPEGAIPKDGPSAGITMATALVSALTNIPVSRFVAMTGEVTLRGRVLPIGGLKEKALGAHRAGITHIVIPKDNEKDIAEIPESVKKGLTFTAVSHMDEVLEIALVRDPNEDN